MGPQKTKVASRKGTAVAGERRTAAIRVGLWYGTKEMWMEEVNRRRKWPKTRKKTAEMLDDRLFPRKSNRKSQVGVVGLRFPSFPVISFLPFAVGLGFGHLHLLFFRYCLNFGKRACMQFHFNTPISLPKEHIYFPREDVDEGRYLQRLWGCFMNSDTETARDQERMWWWHCGCGIICRPTRKLLWKGRLSPKIISTERAVNPFFLFK